MVPLPLVLAVLGCSDPVFYPQTTRPYDPGQQDGTGDSADGAGDGTDGAGDGTDGAGDGTDGAGDGADGTGPTSPFEGVPCTASRGETVAWSWDARTARSPGLVQLIEEDCSLYSLGGYGADVVEYTGRVGEVWVFTNYESTVAYTWVELQADNPDPVVIP